MRCPVCGKPAEEKGEFCPLHSKALANIKRAFKAWKEAYGGLISLNEYLEEIINQPETGEASKELALRILKGDLEWDED
ncbi:MAG: hypothetical protein QXE79_05745 [Candidatus Bathyarchaeia archaeon]